MLLNMLDFKIKKLLEAVPNGRKCQSRSNHPRRMEQKRRLTRLFEETKRKYGVGVFFSVEKQRLIRDTVNNKNTRQACNRRFRHRMNRWRYDKVQDGGAYRKHEEYWWAII